MPGSNINLGTAASATAPKSQVLGLEPEEPRVMVTNLAGVAPLDGGPPRIGGLEVILLFLASLSFLALAISSGL